MKPNIITLRVWGDFACFTRPEMKVERVSYPVMTPSAARGILEAVFWEPQMRYLIDSIRVVKRGCWVSIRRNEVTKVVSLDNAKTWMNSPDKVVPLNAGAGADTDCAQRNMLALQGVEYHRRQWRSNRQNSYATHQKHPERRHRRDDRFI
jgi:CRISPR-associated protein Cas5d